MNAYDEARVTAEMCIRLTHTINALPIDPNTRLRRIPADEANS